MQKVYPIPDCCTKIPSRRSYRRCACPCSWML